jgi:hypothetical protein
MRRSWLTLAACTALVLAGGGAAAATVTVGASQAVTTAQAGPNGDGPTGFWYGTDSATVPVTSSAPYSMPYLGGAYGGYIGMTGNWANLAGCHKIVVWSATNSAQANTNYTKYGKGIGTGVYWFMGGPGVDPHYNGTTSEAYAWGGQQAARTLYDISHVHVTYPVVFMDVEIPGNAPNYTPAPDNGWNTVYTSACSGVVKQHHIPAAVDRADFNGFAAYITAHSSYKVGVYSAPSVWASIFGTGTASLVPNTYEWTYWPETSSLSNAPYGWGLNHGSGAYAQFFGGQTYNSKYALMWQWSGGGGIRNGVGDFDQIDANRQG